MNKELSELNGLIENARAPKLEAMELAIKRRRGVKRWMLLAVARMLGRIESLCVRARTELLNETESN